jgi:hypothetical protein
MLFLIVHAKNRTSGPKGHKYDNVYAGDKSPAYPETEFFGSLFSRGVLTWADEGFSLKYVPVCLLLAHDA